MKNTFYTRSLHAVFALGTPALMSAQTLTEANSVPAIGHTETRTYYSQFGADGLATSGTGNTWDATGATPFGISTTVTYNVPGDSPYAASYPTTTICMHRTDGMDEEWRHYRVDASMAELLGANTDVFDGGRTFCTFPFSMGSSFSDTYSINGGPPSTETDEFVASGVIEAPWGTIPNVVMFSVNGGVSYYFYTTDNLLDAVGTFTPSFGLDLWRVGTSTAVTEKEEANIGLWPVPASDIATLSLPFTGDVSVKVFDGTGREVRVIRTNTSTLSLDLRLFVPGIYMLSATDANGRRATGRLVKK